MPRRERRTSTRKCLHEERENNNKKKVDFVYSNGSKKKKKKQIDSRAEDSVGHKKKVLLRWKLEVSSVPFNLLARQKNFVERRRRLVFSPSGTCSLLL